MINFASLFGSFSRGGNSAINDIIDKPDTSLDQLLDIESFPNQYKSGNGKILQFMKYHKYKELLQYVTVEGPVDNQKKGYKFPMVAAEILSVQNNIAIDYFLPDNKIQIDVEYDSTEEVDFEVDDDDSEQAQAQSLKAQEKATQMIPEDNKPEPESSSEQKADASNETSPVKQETGEEIPKPKKKKIIKQKRAVKKTKKQAQEPLMSELLSYYESHVNYTLAGYNCKVLSMLFTKKPAQFFKFIFNSNKNYVQSICNHIESKSVGDLIVKMLVWETPEFVEERKKLYDHLISLMSELKESHKVLSNLAGAIYEVIQKTSTYIKSKPNIANNQDIIRVFLNIFYRTSEVHKIVNNTMSEEQNRSGYNCLILHAYLYHTEVQTFNSFKLQQVLQTFITKASEKLRNIPNRKVLGMGRLKIVEIFSFLTRKQPKTVEEENKTNEMSAQLLQELYIHSMIANVPDFFSILIKLLQSFDNNNILHNEVYRIFQSVLKEPEQNGSALQQLLLNQDNVLLKFIVSEADNDHKGRTSEKYTRRRGYIAHVIGLCKLIDSLESNSLVNQRLRKAPQFQQVMKTLVARDTIDTNKSLAGYQMKKNPARDIMFQKQDILNTYAQFLTHCPKPVFEPEEPVEEPNEPVVEQVQQQQNKRGEKEAQKHLIQEQNDEQKFNQVVATSKIETSGQSDPKFWITHMNYDIDQLMDDVL